MKLKRLFARMGYKIVRANTRPLEIAIAVQSMLWGILLLFPANTFDTSKIYSVMAQVASEEVWGVLTLFSGVFQLISAHIHQCELRRYSTILSLLIWGFIDAAFWLSGSPSTGATTYLVTVLVLIWSLVNLYTPKGS